MIAVSRKHLPVGPWLLTLLVLAVGAYQLTGDCTIRRGPWATPPKPLDNPFRVATWNLELHAGDGVVAGSVPPNEAVRILSGLELEAIALQNVPEAGYADQMARGLGPTWRAVTVRWNADGPSALALLIVSSVTLLERSLIDTGTPDEALSISILGPNDRHIRLACVRAPESDAQRRRTYVQGLLAWSRKDTSAVTILAGPLHWPSGRESLDLDRASPEADTGLRERFAQVFLEVDPVVARHGEDAGPGAGGLYVTRPGAQILDSVVVDGTTLGPFRHKPLLVQIEVD